MKTSIACRLSTSLAVTVAVIFSFTGCKDNPVNEKPGTPENDDKDTVEITAPFPEKAISDYFKSALKGEDTLFNEYHAMKDYGSIGENREKIWEIWKSANESISEELLPSPDDLENPAEHSWNLPAELEPNAIMPFYYGAKGSAPSEGYPLFVYLHGSGPKDAEWSTGLSLCKGFDDNPSIYFIPQIPNEGEYYRWWQKAKQYAWEKLLRLAFLADDINPDRIYFFGISEGGYGSQRLASYYADYLAGAGPMAGGEPLKNAPAENCANIAFSLRTGADDNGFYRNTLTGYAKDAFDMLEAAHPGMYVHDIELIPGYGHSIDYYRTTPWLKQYERNPYPKYVAWENYEMDGMYRKGFYNIAVLERSNQDFSTRTFYEMSIYGNEITMTVDDIRYTTTEKDPIYGIEMQFSKDRTPSQKGRFIVYLCPELVNLDEEVTLTVNGKVAFEGLLEPELKHIVNSCAIFFDPHRLYPAAIEVDLSNLQ